MKPFLKWAGGKSYLLEEIKKYVPPNINVYFEPFVGGGAVFFGIGGFQRAILSDSNAELINTYKQLRDNPTDLLGQLAIYKSLHEFAAKNGSADIVYYGIREINNLDNIGRAARLIYLNRTCYNGLYRVNAKGKFNTPFGNYTNPTICNSELLLQCSDHLAPAKLFSRDFREILPKAKQGDFVYLDPPYIPVEKTSFVSYAAKKFTEQDHKDLAAMFDLLTKNGVSAILSNSATKLTRKLYAKYSIVEVTAPRRINSNGKGRGKVTEYLIVNY